MSRLGNTNIRFRIYLAARLRYIDPLKGVREVNIWCKYIYLLLKALIYRPIYDLNQNICSCIFQDCLAVEVKSQNECRVEISFNYCPVTISVSGSVMVTVVTKRYWWWGQWGQWPTLTFLHNIDNIYSPGRYRAARCGRTARTWSCLTAPGDGECLGRVVSSCHVCRGYLGGAGRGDLRYSEQAEQVGNLEMDLGNRRQEYLTDFFNKYCLFSKDLIHTQLQLIQNQSRNADCRIDYFPIIEKLWKVNISS